VIFERQSLAKVNFDLLIYAVVLEYRIVNIASYNFTRPLSNVA